MTLDEYVRDAVPSVPPDAARAVLALLADGATTAFVAAYRGDRIGGLGEGQVRAVADAKARWDALHERQRFVCEEIARAGTLAPALRARIDATFDREALDDLYLPYKRKRRTAGVVAAEAGLGPLADWIWNCGHGLDAPLPGQTLELWAFTFRSETHDVPDADAAIAGAEHLLVERLAETAALRARVRDALARDGWLHASRGERGRDGGRFASYYDGCESVAALGLPANARHYLALRRGVNEGELRVRLGGPPDDETFVERLRALVLAEACPVPDSPGAPVLARAAARAFDEQLLLAAEIAVHKALRIVADEVAIADVEAEARHMLLAAPLGPLVVLAVDPAVRGGSKVAVVDGTGRPLAHGVIHGDTDEKRARAGEALRALAVEHGVQAIAIGDGPAAKDVARFVRGALRAHGVTAPVVVVSEVGARAWAASEAAREALPDHDAGVRAAVSLARRLQDPLAELTRLEPRMLATGPHVHDVSQPRLESALEATVTACVADVGVDVNAAPEHLLARVPGLTAGLARALVLHRVAHGPFASRAALRGVALVDAPVFEQTAGFLRVTGGAHPLDATAVHPERYDALERAAARLGVDVAALCREGARRLAEDATFATEVGDALSGIVSVLERGDRDPRGRLEPPEFLPALRTPADLTPGLVCPGVVTSVAAFGAFVDVGLPHDGLVHVSRLADTFVKDPHAVVRVGDRVTVTVVDVNPEKQQFALSMRREPEPRQRGPQAAPPPRGRDAGARTPPEARRERRPPREAPRPAFNNPFADLATQLRGGGKSSGPTKPPSA